MKDPHETAFARSLIATAESYWKLEPGAICGRGKHEAVSVPRLGIYYALRELGWSNRETGDLLGRDQSTVSNGIKVFGRQMRTDERLRDFMGDLLGYRETYDIDREISRLERLADYYHQQAEDADRMLVRARELASPQAPMLLTRVK